jgi:hypothetical protein
MTATELAWAAGFFDGEGSVCTRKRGGWRELWLQVPQSGDTETLYRFQRAVGIGKVCGPWQYRPNMLPSYRFDVRGKMVEPVIKALWPYLSGPKRAQAEKAIDEYRAYLKIRNQRGPGRATLSTQQVERLRARHLEVRVGRQRVPRGWIEQEAIKLGVKYHTVAHILGGHGYGKEARSG